MASGKKDTERPGFTRLIRDCERGAINLVMMKSMSRFGRDTVEVLEMYRRIHDAGADVYFQEEEILTPNGEKKEWSRGSVTGVLHQGKYTGNVTISASDDIGSSMIMTEAIPAIISEDTFQKVQREMEKRTRRKVKK